MSMFSGLSTLRKAEKKEPTPQNKALSDYLKRQYGGGTAEDEPKRKKKKKAKQGPSAIAILDADITGLPPVSEAAAKPARPELDAADDSEGDEPVIANPEEAEALRQQIEKSRNFYAKGQDGSGWEAAGADEPRQQQQQQTRRRQQHDSPSGSSGRDDLSPPRRQRHDTPPRGRSNGAAGGRSRSGSPPRRARPQHDSPDLSPPRRGAAAAAAAAGGGSSDLSPPRRSGRQRHDSPDLSPPRRGAAAAAAAGGDLLPPRRGRQRHDSADLSPPRKPAAAAAAAGDLPPTRRSSRQQRHDSPPDASPPRRRRHDSPDAGGAFSPPRSSRDAAAAAAAAAAGGKGGAGSGGGSSRPVRMTDGTAAGLVSSKELAEEAARLRAQADERKRRAAGRGEGTVYRDKQTGAIISADEYAEQVAKSRRRREPPEEVQVAWKGGLAQKRAAAEAAQRAATEAGKAFGRSFDDDADADLRGRNRWGDPMAGKLSSRQALGDGFDLPPPLITEANRAMMEASGFNVPQEVPQHSWLRRKVPAPVNRYSLKPGRHWDGVDRSNGFEKQMFKMLNQRNAQELEARMWAQEDM